jgi:hypothetical protein
VLWAIRRSSVSSSSGEQLSSRLARSLTSLIKIALGAVHHVFRTMYRRGMLTSYEEFVNLFTVQFQQTDSDVMSHQAKWEDARQLKNQSFSAYYAYLLQQQATHAAVAWKHRP